MPGPLHLPIRDWHVINFHISKASHPHTTIAPFLLKSLYLFTVENPKQKWLSWEREREVSSN